MYEVNFLAIALGAVSAMVVGALWYGPLFGKVWMGLVGVSKKDLEAAKNKMMMLYGVSFLAYLVMAFGMSYVVSVNNATSAGEGAFAAFWVWLPFVATTMLITNLFQNKPFKLTVVDSGYHLVNLVVMGVLAVLL